MGLCFAPALVPIARSAQMDLTGVGLILLVLVLVLGLVLELYRRMQRTRIFQLPDGLRFEAYNFFVQVHRQQQQVHVHCARGLLMVPHAGASTSTSTEPVQPRPLDHVFAAAGFSIALHECTKQKAGHAQPVPTGYCHIVFEGADGTQLTIERVSATVATSFQSFYLQIRRWIVRLEQRLERERVERLRSDDEAAQTQRDEQLMAQLLEGRVPNAPLSEQEREAMAAAQIAHWRSAAGFEGAHSVHHTDIRGRVVWFLDLADDGRITLHADRRTLHTTLRGATVVSNNGELEVSVRDAHWNESVPELSLFRVLRGRSAEERRIWRERLDIKRMGLGS